MGRHLTLSYTSDNRIHMYEPYPPIYTRFIVYRQYIQATSFSSAPNKID